MKAILELEFKDLSIEKIQLTLRKILHTLKDIGMTENGKVEIHTSNGVVTENCILRKERIVA